MKFKFIAIAVSMIVGQLFVQHASAAVFHSTYTGNASFDTGAEHYGKVDDVNYDFTAVFAYDTARGSVTSTPLSERFTGPFSLLFNIGGTVFTLEGSAASYVSREQTLPTLEFPYYQNFATDELSTGPTVLSGDFVAAGVSFISASPISFIPPSVTTPFGASAGPLTLDNIGSFSLDGGATTGVLNSSTLVISQVPLPSSAPMFGAALVALGAAGYGLKRNAKAAA